MKKLVLIAVMVLALAGISWAESIDLKLGEGVETVSSKLPELSSGISFGVIDNSVNYLSTVEIAKISDKVSFEVGYATNGSGDTSDHKLVSVLSVDLLNLGDFINFPILKYVKFQPGLFVSVAGINTQRIMESELDWGPSLTLLDFKF